jgi:O-antigen/teichoic acid export membrane protein
MPAFGLGSALGLLIGLICSQVVLVLALTGASKGSIFPALSGGLHLLGLARTTWRKMELAVFGSLSALLNVISWQAPIFGISACFGAIEVGQFSLGMRLIQVPLQVLGSSLSQVFLQFGAEQDRSGSLAAAARHTYCRLLALTLFPGMMLGLVGVEAFSFAFGDNWRLAGEFAQILSPWACVWFIASPLSVIYVIKGRKREELGMQALLLLTRVTAVVIGAAVGDSIVAVVLLSAGGSLVYGAVLWRALRLAGISTTTICLDASRALGYAIPFLVPVLLAKLLQPKADLLILASAVASAAAFTLRLLIQAKGLGR